LSCASAPAAPTPAGGPFTQALAREYAPEQWLVFACDRYEGINQVVITRPAGCPSTRSIGDHVLVGGEVAVMAIVEAVARLMPGVLSNPASAEQDSFSNGLLEGPASSARGLARPRRAGGAPVQQPRPHRSLAP
jgi:tRNA (guanine37-N1)-methyltransferase